MTMDGTYSISVKTPMGNQEGSLIFKSEGSVLTGSSIAGENTSEIQEGTIDGSNFFFIVYMKTPLGKMKAKVNGSVDGNLITGTMKVPIGTMTFDGTKID